MGMYCIASARNHFFARHYYSSTAANNNTEMTTFYIDFVVLNEIFCVVKTGTLCVGKHLKISVCEAYKTLSSNF